MPLALVLITFIIVARGLRDSGEVPQRLGAVRGHSLARRISTDAGLGKAREKTPTPGGHRAYALLEVEVFAGQEQGKVESAIRDRSHRLGAKGRHGFSQGTVKGRIHGLFDLRDKRCIIALEASTQETAETAVEFGR